MKIIDADHLVATLKRYFPQEALQGITSETLFAQILTDIGNEPTIDAELVKHGEWIKTDILENQFKCSECGKTVTANLSIVDPTDFEFYCYNCGAKMDNARSNAQACERSVNNG